MPSMDRRRARRQWIRPLAAPLGAPARGLLAAMLLAAAFTSGSADAVPADATEQRLIEQARAREARAIALLEELVNINSGTQNFAGVRQVAERLRPELAALGFRARWLDGSGFGRAGHLVAERPGDGPHVLLIGHLDTVFEPDHPFQRFERADAHIARGPGTSDMKGGIVVALTALGALDDAQVLGRLRLTFVLHGDEEDPGAPLARAREALVAAAASARVALGLENAADDPKTAVTGRRSAGRWQLEVTGRSAHSSQIFLSEVGPGAIYELARILNRFYEELSSEEHLTFNPGLVAGSTQLDFRPTPLAATASGKDNIIAPVAIASGDLRALTPEQVARAKQRMQAIVADHLPHTTATLSFDEGYPPMAPSAGNQRLLALYDAVSRDLGFGEVKAVDPRRAGAADIAFAAAHVEMALDGLGLLGGGAHTPGEYADLRTLPVQTQRLALLLYRLSADAGP